MDHKLASVLKTLNKNKDFMSRVANKVYKEIAIFVKDILKCPVCCTVVLITYHIPLLAVKFVLHTLYKLVPQD